VNTEVFFSSKSDEWATPQALYDKLHARFGFTRDVCATPENAKCPAYFSKADDALTQEWTGVCWMNPPYGRGIGRWMQKARASAKAGATVVCLVPVRTDTEWWQENIENEEGRFLASELSFLRGRLKFGGAKSGAPFPSAIVVYRSLPAWLRRPR
jgi:phage N-6-adenine-methyltransferase